MLTNLGKLKYDHNIDHALVNGLTMEEVSRLVMFAVNGNHKLDRVVKDGVVKIYDNMGRLVLAHVA